MCPHHPRFFFFNGVAAALKETSPLKVTEAIRNIIKYEAAHAHEILCILKITNTKQSLYKREIQKRKEYT